MNKMKVDTQNTRLFRDYPVFILTILKYLDYPGKQFTRSADYQPDWPGRL